MGSRMIHTLQQKGYVIFIVDLSNASEELFCHTISKIEKKAMESTVPFAIINKTNQLFINAKMRQVSSKIGANLKTNELFIGICIYGSFSSFVTIVVKFAFSEMNFGRNLKECVQILKTRFNSKSI